MKPPKTAALWMKLEKLGWRHDSLPISTIMASHEQIEKELADAKEQWRMSSVRRELSAKLDAERAMSDRMAALLQRDRDEYGGQKTDPSCDCCDCEYLRPIDDALAAWEAARNEARH